jgi:hypothetical protein
MGRPRRARHHLLICGATTSGMQSHRKMRGRSGSWVAGYQACSLTRRIFSWVQQVSRRKTALGLPGGIAQWHTGPQLGAACTGNCRSPLRARPKSMRRWPQRSKFTESCARSKLTPGCLSVLRPWGALLTNGLCRRDKRRAGAACPAFSPLNGNTQATAASSRHAREPVLWAFFVVLMGPVNQ